MTNGLRGTSIRENNLVELLEQFDLNESCGTRIYMI